MHPPSDDARCVCGHRAHPDTFCQVVRNRMWACACVAYAPVRRLSQLDEDESI